MAQILPKDVVTLISPYMWEELTDEDLKKMYELTIDTMIDNLALARTSKGARHAYREFWPQLIDFISLEQDATKKNQLWWFMSQFLSKSLETEAVGWVLFMKDNVRFILHRKGNEIEYNGRYLRDLEFIINQWESRSSTPNFIYQVFLHGYCFKKTSTDTNAICSQCPSKATFTCIRTDDNFCDKCAENP